MNRNIMRRPGGATNDSFVSSHIRNLDSELAMLQRKREALQYEQQRLVNERAGIRKRPYESDPLSESLPYYRRQGVVQNFAHLYDDGSERTFGGPQPKKCPPVNVWDDNRFDVNQSSVTQRLGPYMGPNPQNRGPVPLMGIAPKPIGRRMLDIPPKKDRNFAPNKVTKAKSKLNTPPQINSAPVPPKNKISAKTMQKLPILRSNEEPSGQVSGRLGLALGSIVKKMKEQYCITPEANTLFNSKHMQRYIRKIIRERLNTIMLNRVVGKPEEVVAAYRKVYPAHTDKLILDNANVNADYDRYLKFNIARTLTEKLDELFEKMQQLCDGKDIEVRKIIKPLISSSSEDKIETNKEVKLSHEFMNSLTIALIEENLPQLLPKYTQKIIKMLDLENEITTYLEKNVKRVRRRRKVDENSPTDNTENKDTDGAGVNTENKDTDAEGVNTENKDTGAEGVNTENKNTDAAEVNTENKDTDAAEVNTTETENNEVTDETTKAAIVENPLNVETNEDVETAKNEENLNDAIVEEPNPTEAMVKTEPATPKAQQYYVKVLGKPTLPNRPAAYKFFSSLNAVTIKKHKVIQNLLVVAFNNEKDYEKAVAASETIVGDCKLIIKANENQAVSTTTTPMKEKTEPENSDTMLTPDLENQISDLLSSIREADKPSPEKATIKKEDSSTESIKNETNNEPSDSIVNNDANGKEENTVSDNENKTNEENVYSPTNVVDEDAKELETIKEVDECTSETKTNVANIKNNGNTGKGTPMKTRQSVATPRTIRTRRSSKLEQQNN